MVQCPECGEEYSPQGLYGHLRMQHGLSGADLQQTYENSLKGDIFEEEPEADGSAGEEGEPVGDGAPAAESEEPVEATKEEGKEESFDPAPADAEEQPDSPSEERREKESREREQREPMRTEFEERGALARAAERLRRARTRRRVVEEAMETKEEVVNERFFEDETEEVPANATWSYLLEACAEEEARALEDLKNQVFHTEGRPKE